MSEVVKKNGAWRIKRSDGEIVGAYATKILAEKALKIIKTYPIDNGTNPDF